jgi:hypothetical protein
LLRQHLQARKFGRFSLAGIIGNKSREAAFESGGDVPEIEAAKGNLA